MKSKCKSLGILTLGMFLTIVCLMPFLVRAETPQGWKTECVGYYQLSFPGEVEVALTHIEANGERTGYQFMDGIKAESPPLFVERVFFVTSSTPQFPDAFEQVIRDAKKDTMEKKKKLLAEGERHATDRIRFYTDLMPTTFRVDGGWSATFYTQRDGRIHIYSIPNPYSPEEDRALTAEETKKFNVLVNQFLKRFQTRALFEIPPKSGLCMPYVFIVDEDEKKGKTDRGIAVNFRLKAHPDVEIYFSDTSVSSSSEDAKKKLRSFWDNYSAKRLKLEGGFDAGFRPVKIAGREGVATQVEITREYDAVDYGYSAYVTGDGYAAQVGEKEAPHLMFYVIRTAAHTRGTPMSKKDLLKLAEQIAASVKRRMPK